MKPAAALILAALAVGSAAAQSLPPPSRSVYRCEVDGKVTYTDAPCLAAQRVDLEPTRGLTTTGKERPGRDVQREKSREQLAEAVRPLTHMDARQFDQSARRTNLPPETQRECLALDRRVAALESEEPQTSGDRRKAVQFDLLQHRTRASKLRCNG